MDYQTMVSIGFGITGFVCTVLGWFLKALQDSHKDLVQADRELTEKVQHIEVLVAGNYVKREHFETFSNAMFAKMDKILDKLDGKADK